MTSQFVPDVLRDEFEILHLRKFIVLTPLSKKRDEKIGELDLRVGDSTEIIAGTRPQEFVLLRIEVIDDPLGEHGDAVRFALAGTPSHRMEEGASEVCRIEVMLKLALSSRIDVVSSATSLLTPPMTPAMPTDRSASAMTNVSRLNVRWV